MKYHNIVISGDIGTGTSTLAKNLSEKLGWQVISFGDYFRAYVKENKIDLWNKLDVPAEWEYKMDGDFHKKLENEEKLIVDGHYQGYLSKDLEDIFRILLVCDDKLSEERILKRQHTHEETPETISKRRQGLRDSFKKLYGSADYFDPKLFHLVINTADFNEAATLEKAYQSFVNLQKDWC